MIGLVMPMTAERIDIHGVKRLGRVRGMLRAVSLHVSCVLVSGCERPVDADPAGVEQRKHERHRGEERSYPPDNAPPCLLLEHAPCVSASICTVNASRLRAGETFASYLQQHMHVLICIKDEPERRRRVPIA